MKHQSATKLQSSSKINMKHIIYISTLFILLLTGCSKPQSSPGPEQFDRYIFFSQNVDTKASLIGSTTDMDGRSFGVVGFKYDNASTWAASKADATPNVFTSTPQEVSCDENGYGTYSPIQGWSSSKKYTFFAFYPMPIENTVALVNLDGTAYTAGVPAIKYNIDRSSNSTLKASMIDVMTGDCNHIDSNNKEHNKPCQEDLYWKSATENNVANGEVGFSLQHRLSSLGIKIKNSSAGDITSLSIYLNISNIQYQQIIIPLDKTAVTPSGEPFDIDLFRLDVSDASSLAPGSSNYTELNDKLILIPQSSNISITLIISYKRKFGSNAPSDLITADPVILETPLIAGNKHLISLNFKDATVEVGGEVSTEGWIDIPDVEDTFN